MNAALLQFSLEPVDNTRLARLCGAFDENLRQVEIALEVVISRRGEHFSVQGEPHQAELARQVLQDFYRDAKHDISLEQLQLGLIEVMKVAREPETQSGFVPLLMTRKAEIRGRTPRQNDYLQAIQQHDITFGVGPAGTGKTYLAVACAVDALQREAVKRLVLVRPAVEAGERLGFLPGDMAQKVDPYLRPLYDALYDLMGVDKVTKAFERGVIEIAPLAYMRGRTINHSFIILDEAQNTTPEQMKMFLTRIGFGSKAVITGDVTQIDLARGQKSGLIEVRGILKEVRGIAFSEFLAEDVVRHPLVQKIVAAYERHEQEKKPQP
ncbi:MAG: PhoH family protein [Gallionellaceae bacterium]|nr:PhoH family protein [Gallionellaceae bacterium]